FHQSEEIDKMLPGIAVLYVLDAATLALSIFGVYGARKEKKWAVILFSVGMSLASLYLFVNCVKGYQAKHEMEELSRKEDLAMMPLSGAKQNDIEQMYYFQANLKCCGLVQGYQDWGTDIPLSCLCSDEDSTDFKCVARGNNTRFVIHYPNSDMSDDDHKGLMDEHILIYKDDLHLMIGTLAALNALWDVGVALAITILCQMRRKVDVPPVIFTSQPPRYRELCDTAESV
uniref:Tetraspanin n=1 Tax=Oncorhynchus mykiss TaxID=8022 RepID=A0A8C7PB16_ONCMY